MNSWGDVQPNHNESMWQEVTVQTAGLGSETATGGVRVNLIPKDGGNSVSGSTFFAYAGHSMQGDNLTPELRALGVSSGDAVDKLWDFSTSLGGPIVLDKLWYFGSFRHVGNRNIVANAFMPDGSPGIFDQTVKNVTGRITWQANAKNKISVYNDRAFKALLRELGANTEPSLAAGGRKPVLYYTGAVKWSSPVTNKLLLEAGWGGSVQSRNTGRYQPGVRQERGTPRVVRRCVASGSRDPVADDGQRGRDEHHRAAVYVHDVRGVRDRLAQHEVRPAVALRCEQRRDRFERRPDSAVSKWCAGLRDRPQRSAVRAGGRAETGRGPRHLRAGLVELQEADAQPGCAVLRPQGVGRSWRRARRTFRAGPELPRHPQSSRLDQRRAPVRRGLRPHRRLQNGLEVRREQVLRQRDEPVQFLQAAEQPDRYPQLVRLRVPSRHVHMQPGTDRGPGLPRRHRPGQRDRTNHQQSVRSRGGASQGSGSEAALQPRVHDRGRSPAHAPTSRCLPPGSSATCSISRRPTTS